MMPCSQAPATPWALTAHQAPSARATRWGSGWPAPSAGSALAKQTDTSRSSPTSTRRTVTSPGRTWTPCMARRRTRTTAPPRRRTRPWRRWAAADERKENLEVLVLAPDGPHRVSHSSYLPPSVCATKGSAAALCPSPPHLACRVAARKKGRRAPMPFLYRPLWPSSSIACCSPTPRTTRWVTALRSACKQLRTVRRCVWAWPNRALNTPSTGWFRSY